MRRVMGVVLVVCGLMVAAAVAVGCGSGGSGATPELNGTSWILTGWSASSLDPNDFTITAEFTDGTVGGKAAVNSYSAPYTAEDDGALSVGAIASTQMAGPEADMRAEGIYLELLAAARKVKLDGDTLTLCDEGGNESLIYAAK